MNILISDSWLREHLKTKATPKKIAEVLSLHSQSVEKLTKIKDDWLYEIEITTNRADCLSVYGIARELAAILPRENIQAKLQPISKPQSPIPNIKNGLTLEVKITEQSLCPRFSALIFDNIAIKPSPKIVRERLEKSGIRALNNVVDISNYLMLELGQPMHTFDYDKIKRAKMTLRQAQGKEKITTLDGQTRVLPAGTIIIEDGEGRIIDLCGIMGGENSAVDENTKRVLLFIQTYDPARIRRACQNLAFRTDAASRFEKGVDPEGVMLAMEKAILMFEKNCDTKVTGKLIDIYPNPPKKKTIKLDLNLVNKIIGIEIPKNEIVKILKSLGFSLITNSQLLITVSVPHWRNNDISLPEDLIEEIARIYGYYRLPAILPFGKIKTTQDRRFFWERKIKDALKYWGFSEILSFSMVGEELLQKIGLDSQNYLKISNPLTLDFVYMRPSLIPSLLQIVSQNQNNFSEIRIFEVANIYIPQGKNNLPDEIPMLAGAQTGSKFLEIKGILEALFEDLGIKDYQFQPPVSSSKFYSKGKAAEILISGKPVGILGEIEPAVCNRFEISKVVTLFELELGTLVKYASNAKEYVPIPQFPPIIEDLSFTVPPKTQVEDLIQLIELVSSIVQSVDLIDVHNDTRTFRIIYQDPQKTLNDKEVEKIREKIIKRVEEKFGAKLKQ